MVKAIKNIMRERGTDSHLLYNLNDSELLLLHNTLLNMLIDILEACKKCGVELTLIGGSVLGAVRHNGFIPWDDDLDIGMRRHDFEKFKYCFLDLLGDKYALEAPNYDEKDTKYLLSQIHLIDSEWVMLEQVNLPYHNCIYVDLFVIDNVSNNRFIYNIDSLIANFLRAGAITMLEYKYPSPIFKEAMMSNRKTKLYYYLRQFIGMCFSVISHKNICDFFDKFVSRHKCVTQRSTVATGLKKYKAETLDNEDWFPFSKGVFCGIEVNLPHNVEKYLSYIYGEDYMKLPPVDKRETHPVFRCRFPNSDK